MTTRPARSTAARSVKVPPTSAPIRYTRSDRQVVGAGLGVHLEGVERARDHRVVAHGRRQLDDAPGAEPLAEPLEESAPDAMAAEELRGVRHDLRLGGRLPAANGGDRLEPHAGLPREPH